MSFDQTEKGVTRVTESTEVEDGHGGFCGFLISRTEKMSSVTGKEVDPATEGLRKCQVTV